MTLRELFKTLDDFDLDDEVLFDVTPSNAKTFVFKSIDDIVELQIDRDNNGKKEKLIILLNGAMKDRIQQN